MATLTVSAEINLLDAEGSVLSSGSTQTLLSNVSSNLGHILGFKRGIAKTPFIIGVNNVGDNCTVEEDIGYLLFNEISSLTTGEFENNISFTISGTALDHFTIVFDTQNNEYPTSVIVDGVSNLNDDANFTIGNLSGDTHTIEIPNWSAKGRQCLISGIFVGLKIVIDEKNLIEFSRTLQDRSDFELPSYGIVSGTGHIKFNDNTREILDYAKQNLLKADLDIELFLNEKLSGTTMAIGKFKSDKWSYDDLNFSVSVDMKDNLTTWQNFFSARKDLTHYDNVTGQEYDTSAYDILNLIKVETQKSIPDIVIEVSKKAEDRLKSIFPSNYYFDKQTLWSLWDSFCNTTKTRLYYSNNKLEIKL